ncbi:hypothetical protein HAP47_0032740 [Bradyrhizobium sp. 41S5]|uniref:hypothetical protein n=1 Tax=Bradyrhizobium sp. 41S5 TaxID=1404443 RepID=UPI00156B884B|nr:hypothetical protein [Bradyrhizobium sp. 41S5]UFX43936.1 hypothetical protein HAP47_0032740 [Bradyrhizobium sp. 41S5]
MKRRLIDQVDHLLSDENGHPGAIIEAPVAVLALVFRPLSAAWGQEELLEPEMLLQAVLAEINSDAFEPLEALFEHLTAGCHGSLRVTRRGWCPSGPAIRTHGIAHIKQEIGMDEAE